MVLMFSMVFLGPINELSRRGVGTSGIRRLALAMRCAPLNLHQIHSEREPLALLSRTSPPRKHPTRAFVLCEKETRLGEASI